VRDSPVGKSRTNPAATRPAPSEHVVRTNHQPTEGKPPQPSTHTPRESSLPARDLRTQCVSRTREAPTQVWLGAGRVRVDARRPACRELTFPARVTRPVRFSCARSACQLRFSAAPPEHESSPAAVPSRVARPVRISHARSANSDWSCAGRARVAPRRPSRRGLTFSTCELRVQCVSHARSANSGFDRCGREPGLSTASGLTSLAS
jgi:hypothetical protein